MTEIKKLTDWVEILTFSMRDKHVAVLVEGKNHAADSLGRMQYFLENKTCLKGKETAAEDMLCLVLPGSNIYFLTLEEYEKSNYDHCAVFEVHLGD